MAVSFVSMAVVSIAVEVTRLLLRACALHPGAWAASPRPYVLVSRGRIGGGRMNTTDAEAPRPARARIDGRSPGSRVFAPHRLPGFPQWLCGEARRIQLRGQPRHWSRIQSGFRTAFPVISLSRDRRPLVLNRRSASFVNVIIKDT